MQRVILLGALDKVLPTAMQAGIVREGGKVASTSMNREVAALHKPGVVTGRELPSLLDDLSVDESWVAKTCLLSKKGANEMDNETLIDQINQHLREADDKLLKSVYRFITRTVSFSCQEGSAQVTLDIISDGTVSWSVRGQQHSEGGRETESFLFDKTLSEVVASEIGRDVGLVYEDVLKDLGWHDEATVAGLPPHAQKTIERIKQ